MKLNKATKIGLCVLTILLVLAPLLYFNLRTTSEEKITIEVWYTYEGFSIIQEQVREYNEITANIEIILSKQPSSGFIDKFISVAQTGSTPDIFLGKASWLGELANLGYIKGLSDFLSPSEEALFFPLSIDGLSYMNELWAIPLWIDSFLLFYNKDLFDENNVKYPTNNWTEQDFITAAKKINDFSQDKMIYGSAWSTLSPYFWPAFQYGFGHGPLYQDGMIIINDSASYDAMKFLYDSMWDHEIVGYSDTSSAASQQFLSKKVGMLIYGGWFLPTLKQSDINYGVEILPYINSTGESLSPFREIKGWGMSKDTKYPDICFDIIKFLSNEEIQLKFLEREHKVPTLNSLIYSTIVQNNRDIITQIEQTENGQYFPFDPLYNVYSDYMRAALQFILLDHEDIGETLDEAQRGINEHV